MAIVKNCVLPEDLYYDVEADLWARLVDFHRWSLARPDGRARAEALGVLEVPTVVIEGGPTIVRVPGDAAVLRAGVLAAAGRT